MKKFKSVCTVLLLCLSILNGQKISSHPITFKAVKLPIDPLPLHLQSYSVSLIPPSYREMDSIKATFPEEEWLLQLQLNEWKQQRDFIYEQSGQEEKQFGRALKMAGLGVVVAAAKGDERRDAALKLASLGTEIARERVADESGFRSALELADFGIDIALRKGKKDLPDTIVLGAEEYLVNPSPYRPQHFETGNFSHDSWELEGFTRRSNGDLTLQFSPQGFIFSPPSVNQITHRDISTHSTYDTVVTDTSYVDTLVRERFIERGQYGGVVTKDTLVVDTTRFDTTITEKIRVDTLIRCSYTLSMEYHHPVICSLFMDTRFLRTTGSADRQQFRSQEFSSVAELESWWIGNKQAVLSSADRTSVKRGISAIFAELNRYHGYSEHTYHITIPVPQSRKQSYEDYSAACSLAIAGYQLLQAQGDHQEAREKLTAAIGIWETALTEAVPNERKVKKARINRDVTVLTYLNIIKAALFSNQFEKAGSYLTAFESLDSKRDDQKIAHSLKEWLHDRKARFDAHRMLSLTEAALENRDQNHFP